MYAIHLEITSSTVETGLNGVPARRLTITATNAQNMPSQVFLMRKVGSAPAELATFCSAADLENFGTTPPGQNDDFTLFRASSITFTDDRPDIVEEFIANIKRRCQSLLDTLKELDENATDTTFIFEA